MEENMITTIKMIARPKLIPVAERPKKMSRVRKNNLTMLHSGTDLNSHSISKR